MQTVDARATQVSNFAQLEGNSGLQLTGLNLQNANCAQEQFLNLVSAFLSQSISNKRSQLNIKFLLLHEEFT